ncbi:hypothetical protein D210916BOD24_03040 [Alteromonas sp. D210916BOD_24]
MSTVDQRPFYEIRRDLVEKVNPNFTHEGNNQGSGATDGEVNDVLNMRRAYFKHE